MILRKLALDDLAAINAVMDGATVTWSLGERVRRLARTALHYREADFAYLSFTGALDEDGDLVAFTAVEPDCAGFGADTESASLHGLYVDAARQGRGIGNWLLRSAIDEARRAGTRRMTLRAWRESASFFRARGFAPGASSRHPQALDLALELAPAQRREEIAA